MNSVTESAWTHLGIVGVIIIPLVVIWLDLRYRQTTMHDQTRREREQEAKQVADAIKERDQKMLFTLSEYPLHRHDERGESETLTTDGLKYPKLTIDKS